MTEYIFGRNDDSDASVTCRLSPSARKYVWKRPSRPFPFSVSTTKSYGFYELSAVYYFSVVDRFISFITQTNMYRIEFACIRDRCISTRHAVVHTHRINANTCDCSRINTKRMRETVHTNCNIIVVKRAATSHYWKQSMNSDIRCSRCRHRRRRRRRRRRCVFFCQFLKWAMGLKWITALLPFNCLFLWWFHMINC